MDIELFEGQVHEAKLTEEQMACLASPARAEVYWNCSTRVPRSIAEIAQSIGHSAAGVTYHVNELVRVGLLLAVDERKRRSRVEKLYVLAARKGFVAEPVGTSPQYDRLLLDGFNALLKLMSREREMYQAVQLADPSFPAVSAWRRQSIQLEPERIQAFNAKIIQLMRDFAAEKADEAGIRITYSYFCHPTLGESRKRLKQTKE